MRHRGKLYNQILTSVTVILLTVTAAGFGLDILARRGDLQHEEQERALSIAQTFAATPSVREALFRHDAADRRLIQSLAEEVRRTTTASYIVVINRQGIRFSHPNASLIGVRVAEPVVALDGRDHLGLDHGNLGVSANAKVPLRSPGGQIIGEVSAGIPERAVSQQLIEELPRLILYFLGSLAVGLIASVILTRRLKRRTFGLELEEIAALVQEREAMLHDLREGVITVNGDDRVTLINDEARRLLSLDESVVGEPLGAVLPYGRLRDLLSGAISGRDQVVLTEEYVLMVNRMPVFRNGQALGAVITLRDRTELEALIRELDGVAALTDALRAQQHEFSNRMHTLAGLIELGHYDDASRYALDSNSSAGPAETIRSRIEPPEVAAMLLAKMTVARERGVMLLLTEDTQLPIDGIGIVAVLTIVGNLIDNAIDAAAEAVPPGDVTVHLSAGDAVRIEVSDSGAGVPAHQVSEIFTDGFTTRSTSGRPRGLGLALVHRLVRESGGSIDTEFAGRTTFSVRLPFIAELQSGGPA